MTGQILGGNPVSEAARYQIMIMYFIALASFGVILMQVTFILNRGFDSDHMLQSNYFEKSSMSGLGAAWVVMTSMMSTKANPTMNEENLQGRGMGLAPSIEINPFHFDISEQDALQLVGISKWFPIEHRDLAGNIEVGNRVLFDDLSFTVHSNEIVFVRGKSGSGKTQLLRSLARLSPLNKGDIFLNGMDQKHVKDMSEYRTKVRYVTQQKVDIPGTPEEFVKQITSFEAVKKDVTHPHDWHIMENTAGFLLKWGLDASILTSEWKNLSGGESQRLLLALALATRPWVILLDEVTSALDEKTTLLVEETLRETSLINGMKIVMVTHDENQIGRLTLHQ